MKASLTRTIRYQVKPVDGKDAVRYHIIPSYSSISLRYVNGSLVPDVSNITVRIIRQIGEDSPVSVPLESWTEYALSVDYAFYRGGKYGISKSYDSGSGIAVNTEASGVTINLVCSGVTIDTVTIPFIKDGTDGEDGKPGDRGSRGPALRVQKWQDCPIGFTFENGTEGKDYLDVVIYGPANGFFVCKNSHTKTANNGPGSTLSAQNSLWTGTTAFDVVATRILLVEYALIKNLGVETVEMKDAEGNVLCRIKDGEVICNTGKFKDVDVAGNITADTMSLKLSTAAPNEYPNGSLIMDISNIRLPELQLNTTRTYKILNPKYSRTSGEDLILTGATSNCRIYSSLDLFSAAQTLTVSEGGHNGGTFYDLLGINKNGITSWTLIEISKNS